MRTPTTPYQYITAYLLLHAQLAAPRLAARRMIFADDASHFSTIIIAGDADRKSRRFTRRAPTFLISRRFSRFSLHRQQADDRA